MRDSYFLILKISALTLLALSNWCCSEEREITLSVTSTHYDKSPVPGAAVLVEKKILCTTNSQGKCSGSTKINLDKQNSFTVEIQKPSDVYYYAPYAASFPVDKESASSLEIKATLYNVPKQVSMASSDASNATDTLKINASEPSSEGAADLGVNNEQDSLNKKGVSQLENSEEEESPEGGREDHLSESTPQNNENPASQDIQEQNRLSSLGYSPQDELLKEIIQAYFTDIVGGTLPTRSYKDFNNHLPRDKKALLSLHALSGNAPVPNARFYLRSGLHEELICSTNERGHCLSTLSRLSLGDTLRIVGKASGLRNSYKDLVLEEKNNIYVPFERSLDLDLSVIGDNLWNTRPVPKASVAIAGEIIGTTDDKGSIFIPASKLDALNKEGLTFSFNESKPQFLPAASILNGRAILAQNSDKPLSVYLMEPFFVSVDQRKSVFDGAEISKEIYTDIKKNLYLKKTFQEFSRQKMRTFLAENSKSVFDLVTRGWKDYDVDLDVIAIPTIIVGKSPRIQLLFLNNEASPLAGAMLAQKVPDSNQNATSSIGNELVKKIMYNLPFLTPLLSLKGQDLEVAIGDNNDSQILSGDKILLVDLNHQNSPIAEGEITKVKGDSSLASLNNNSVLSNTNHLGVIVRPPKTMLFHDTEQSLVLSVRGLDQQALAFGSQGVAIFLDGIYYGTTDSTGELRIAKTEEHQILEAATPGFLSKEISIPKDKKEVVLTFDPGPSHARFASTPLATQVLIDNSIKLKTFFVGLLPSHLNNKDSLAIEFLPKPGYKPQKFIASHDDIKALNFNNSKRVYLPLDEITKIRKDLPGKSLAEANALLNSIPRGDPSYIEAQNLLAQFMLKTSESIDKVLEIMDKRVVTNIDHSEGHSPLQKSMATFNLSMINTLVGSMLIGQDDYSAKKYLNKAYQDLIKINNSLTLTAEPLDSSTQRGVAYFSALSLHFLYTIEQKPKQKNLLTSLWKTYFALSEAGTEASSTKAADFAKQLIAKDESLKRIIF